MVDYWGAQAVWYSSGPDGFGQWYRPPSQDTGASFTMPPSTDGTSTPSIDEIRAQLHNAQPAHISALADQWQNLYNLLFEIRQEVFLESDTLYEEKWKSGAARDAFMRAGPGQALAYLDAWMDSALSNQQALSLIASIILDYQSQMNTLWKEYQHAVTAARNLSGGTKAWDWFTQYNLVGGGDQPDYDRKTGADKIKQVSEVQNKYTVKAQTLAYAMAGEMVQTYSTFSAGHGPLYEAPDAVMDDPMMPHFPGGLPGGPGGLPGGPGGLPAPGAMPPIPSPTPPPAPTPPPLPTPLPAPTPPPEPVPPPMPLAPPQPVPDPAAPVLAPPVIDPGLLTPPVGLVISAPGLGSLNRSPMPSAVDDAVPDPANAPKLPGGSGLGNGLIARSASRLAGESAPPSGMTSRSLRNLTSRPGDGPETPPAGRRAGTRATEPGAAQRAPGQEDLFGGKGAPVSPPVLKNQRRTRSRASTSPAAVSDEFSASMPGRADAVPPVLARSAPPERQSSRRGAPSPGIQAPGADSLTPVLRAPTAAATGPAVSGLEEVPAALRATPTSAAARAASPSPRELVNRRAVGKVAAGSPEPTGETTALPTAEEMFSVETPGGGVLAGHQDESGYTAEAKAQLRAS
jgi:hypothetical protein